MSRRPIAHHIAAFMVVSVIIASPALAFDEPKGFRGVPWGATEEQMRSSVSIERACTDYPVASRHLGDRSCPALLLIGDINVRAICTFRADRLTRVGLTSHPKTSSVWPQSLWSGMVLRHERSGMPCCGMEKPPAYPSIAISQTSRRGTLESPLWLTCRKRSGCVMSRRRARRRASSPRLTQ
jgi:hypothetical protein